ncbi:MAG: class I SAM-dependent methyltransferase [Saprospiraceae bacterium]|nr:class I SAM-dependent methyltransferase [Saprospiraceae bacterium]
MSKTHIEACPVCHSTPLVHWNEVRDHSVTGEIFSVVECPQCALRLTQDHPGQADIGRYYQSDAYVSHTDSRKGLVNRLYHLVRSYMLGRKARLLMRHRKQGAVLDIGAGTGYFLDHMRQRGWHVSGLEPDARARKVAHARFGLDLQTPDQLHWLADDSFDAITLWHVLEHVHTLDAYLHTLHRILRPGGLLVIAVPNHTAFDAAHYGTDWAAYDVPRHLWHFAPKSMRTLHARHACRVTGQRGRPFDAYSESLLSERYRGSALGLLRAPVIGTFSNLRALFNQDRASSVIYLAQHADQ